ncbi:MAG: 4Fe-4S dicluster domain-containing protein [Desulfosarcina sp.]|nr:4Fe-4S dicluster domain-containing protein [Desulfosarcina sp.]
MDKDQQHGDLNRRDFITGMAVTLAAVGAGAAALSPLTNAEEIPSVDAFLQEHYKRLTAEDKKKIFARLEKKIEKTYGVRTTIKDPKPLDDVVYGYTLNIGRCIGCRKCVYACMKENNTSRNPQIQYIRVLRMKKEGRGIDLESADHDYPQNEAGDENYYYMPVQCQQCENPPCVKVCPVNATWKEKDGIVVIDYNWCIGCRYCEAACPYHARRFNFAKPQVPSRELNPDMAYLSNRPRYLGVMEKCTFCLHRTRVGRYPACVEACPTGARKFGNLKDPESEVRKIIENERVYVLKEELGTVPKFYYVFAK